MLSSNSVSEAIEFCESYRENPIEKLLNYQKNKNLPHQSFVRNMQEINLAVGKLDSQVRLAIDCLKKNLDKKNQRLAFMALETSYQVDDLFLSWNPLSSMGLYVPYRFVSSLITWLSAAAAAKVEKMAVFLAQDPMTGNPCPACLYAALLYNADILVGPARFAFPCLAFGDGQQFLGSDLLCGPAGKHLNILKQMSALLSMKKTDFFAGPSELAVAIDGSEHLEQALYDLAAQIEHGPESIGHLIGVNYHVSHELIAGDLRNRVICHNLKSWNEAKNLLNDLAIETIELLGKAEETNKVLFELTQCGVAYANLSSSLGDYCIIGRGCGDPTQGTAKFSSGISPWLFMRMRALVKNAQPEPSLIAAGQRLAEYECLPNHLHAISSFSQVNLLQKKMPFFTNV